MANVKLRYRGPLRDKLGVEEDLAFGKDIGDILKYIHKLYGKDAYKMAKSMLITVDGRSILSQRLFKTELRDGQEISFLPVSAGG